MTTFTCSCGQLLFFENVRCFQCGAELGFLPDELSLRALQPAAKPGLYTAAGIENRAYRKCRHYEQEAACNWMIPADEAHANEVFCVSCRLNEIIPDLSLEQNRIYWKLIEVAKRRLVFTLLEFALPLPSKLDDPGSGLAFRFLADLDGGGPQARVLTGHDNGIITLNVAEADDAHREQVRLTMKEPYRTLLGHFRHEVGHYYWDQLIAGGPFLESFRKLFGDERADYGQALQAYYAAPEPPNWQDRFISLYATSHPWEDWAETWAHYLHIHDTLESAVDFGLVDKRVNLGEAAKSSFWGKSRGAKFDQVIEAWAQLSVALNSINRSMGLPDLYPFVLSKPVVEKLRFVAQVVSAGARK